MTMPRFFGYGSLVNLATHGYADPAPAKLTGWRRTWVQSALRPIAFLSVEPDPDTVIDGITAAVPGGDWSALDAREAVYDRHDVTTAVQPQSPSVATYRAKAEHLGSANPEAAILLSYLDVVVQGFLRIHGTKGAEAFFATTRGWQTPIRNDRAAPLYPRHQTLTPAETATVDAALARLDCRIV